MLEALSAVDARRWAVLTRAAFAARRAEIDALNVYPVPDGDTGTNLYLSLDAALDSVRTEHEKAGILGDASLAQECTAMARSLLLTARGNSGVILSQLVRGFAEAIAESGKDVADAAIIADGLERASQRAYASVTRPAEGTILTVARAAAAAGAAAVERGLAAVAEDALDAATEALKATTSQLPALERAGVVDAGAAGYLLLLEALARVVHQDDTHVGERMEVFADHSMRRREDWSHAGGVVTPTGATGGSPTGEGDLVLDGPAYEVMYLLRDSDEERVATLRDSLDRLGDSLLVVGGPDLWNIHVHVDDVGAAVEAGIDAGRPYRVRVTHFAGQGGGAVQGGRADQVARVPAAGVAVVACAAGPGLAELFEQAGAHVVSSGPGKRASAGQLLDAARAAHALEVIVLPNDGDTVMAAEAAASAAEQEGVTLHIVRSRTAVQGLAALAVFDASASASRNASQMSHAAAATRHGAVAVASKQALTSAGPCEPGDVLGAVAGDVVIVGDDLEAVAIDVVARLLSSGGEIVTVIGGADAPPGLTESLGARIERGHRDVEVSLIDGGQPHYPLLLGVE
ncbi:DAK2 domain-containing protein [Pedococcus bigeumensis]|uniref:DAK2 domain-containing protein n=1 Tax=Pedococcus bigeumensis TaxID=433644 RepID=A0A502CVM9_9MICO|nr:DAK2 domain-containing protein [Pedococcus bigeumensis]TPG16179.1 DAK2 domain-containing protein [Pedococcus bigeumensis]